VHIADPDVAVGTAVPGYGDQSRRGVDARTASAAKSSQFDGQPRPAGDVEQATAGIDAKLVMEGHILPAVARLAQSREIYGLATPALVNDCPTRYVCAGTRHTDPFPLLLDCFLRRVLCHL
jgi:hypothetical protein